jgi:hypothetical protein
MKIFKRSLMLSVLISMMAFVLNSCYYDNEEEMYQLLNNDTTVTCDTSNVTYTVQIKPFFDSKCISCHYDGNTYPDLGSFTTSHAYAVTPGNLLNDHINSGHQSISITACEKAQVIKWINTGAN